MSIFRSRRRCRIRSAGGSESWLAPVERLEIDGRMVDHTNGADWPEDDRVLRVFWFTIEASYLGGDLTVDNVEKLLGQRAYLAPEMGRGLLAATVPDQHNDDQINLGDESFDVAGGNDPALCQGRGGREGGCDRVGAGRDQPR